MGVRNQHREAIERLESKTLDARFTTEIQQGLNCSPFEAEAVLDVVKEVYFPFLSSESPQAPPGKITLIAVAADEPAGKPVSHCKKQTVCLTLHQGQGRRSLDSSARSGWLSPSTTPRPLPAGPQSGSLAYRRRPRLSRLLRHPTNHLP